MLFHLASLFQGIFGPFRLLQSYLVLIIVALYAGFIFTVLLLPRFYKYLPKDRGREFAIHAENALGKPTGAGIVFISIFFILSFLISPVNLSQITVLFFTWLVMFTGYLDDRAHHSWGEYRKGAIDLVLSVAASVALLYCQFGGEVYFWLPFVTNEVAVHPVVFVLVSTLVLWVSINTTNCTDGVDGLSGTLVLLALISGINFLFCARSYENCQLSVGSPHGRRARWRYRFWSLGVLMGYLWHNAFPSKVLMETRAHGLWIFIGICVILSGNPFLLLMTSAMILINGGTGLLKVALLRFFNIRILHSIRFPLHDHMRKNRLWSPTQVLLKFMIMQVLITLAVLGLFFKIR